MRKPLRELLTLLLLLGAATLLAQGKKPAKYWVSFTDKKGTPYSVDRPSEFLSPRALERRFRYGIEVTEEDLPVNPSYVRQLTDSGARIHNTSKWLNAAAILADSTTAYGLLKLDFVKQVRYVGPHIKHKISLRKKKKKRDQWNDYNRIPNHYGFGELQVRMLAGDVLHAQGHQGEHMLVAVMDGGFTNVDIMPFFDSLRQENRLAAGRDFVGVDNHVWESSSHGSHVLSVMGANLPGLLVGTAPEASYVCIKTEDTGGEYLIEECNWVAGAEYADSIGADVVNSSLGYTTFNDKRMNYVFEDLTGKKGIASRAADIAFTKGMIMVNSAGNSGRGPWKYVGVPADAENVFSVGATDFSGKRASFSSFGPSADGRIKPDVATVGQAITVGSIYSYEVQLSNGTSFSAPMMAGMVTSLWGAFPEKTNREILDAIRKSASQADAPDEELGYGIPDFFKAYLYLQTGKREGPTVRTERVQLYPVFKRGKKRLYCYSDSDIPFHYSISDLAGKVVREQKIQGGERSIAESELGELAPGLYILQVFDGEQTVRQLLKVPESKEVAIWP